MNIDLVIDPLSIWQGLKYTFFLITALGAGAQQLIVTCVPGTIPTPPLIS
jgi:hypothetical protein